MFDNLFKKKKPKISKEIFGEVVLSQTLLLSAQKCPSLLEELGVDLSFERYLHYLEYHIFLMSKILEQNHSVSDIQRMRDYAINGVIDNLEFIPEKVKDETKCLLKDLYYTSSDYFENICSDIYSELGLKKLSDSFIEDCGANKGLLSNVQVFAHFSSYITYHTSDILNDKIELM